MRASFTIIFAKPFILLKASRFLHSIMLLFPPTLRQIYCHEFTPFIRIPSLSRDRYNRLSQPQHYCHGLNNVMSLYFLASRIYQSTYAWVRNNSTSLAEMNDPISYSQDMPRMEIHCDWDHTLNGWFIVVDSNACGNIEASWPSWLKSQLENHTVDRGPCYGINGY